MQENHIELIEKFWDFNADNHLSSSSLLIYLFLLKEVFKRNSLRFSISDVYLSKQLGLTRKTVKANKEILQKNGLIKLETKNGVACNYEVFTEYKYLESDIEKVVKEEISRENIESKKKIKTEVVEQHTEQSNLAANDDPIKTNKQKFNNLEVPTLTEFLEFTKTLEFYKPNLEANVKLKYFEWTNNDWKNNFDRPITNWKSALKNTLPYLNKDSENTKLSIQNIPNIRRITFDE